MFFTLLSPLEQFLFLTGEFANFGVFMSNLGLQSLWQLLVLGLFGVPLVLVSRRLTPYGVVFLSFGFFVRSFIHENFARYGKYFFSFFFSLFFFLLLANLLSLIPFSFAITSHLNVTLHLSFMVFAACTFFGFFFYGLVFLSLFLPQGAPFFLSPFLISIELVSYSARLFSLAIRLFANIMSGHTLLKILGSFSWLLLIGAASLIGFIPLIIMVIVTGLEFVISFLQAYVFSVLSTIYINESFFLH